MPSVKQEKISKLQTRKQKYLAIWVAIFKIDGRKIDIIGFEILRKGQLKGLIVLFFCNLKSELTP